MNEKTKSSMNDFWEEAEPKMILLHSDGGKSWYANGPGISTDAKLSERPKPTNRDAL